MSFLYHLYKALALGSESTVITDFKLKGAHPVVEEGVNEALAFGQTVTTWFAVSLQPCIVVTISLAVSKLSITPEFENKAELLSVELLIFLIIQLFVKLDNSSLFLAIEVFVKITLLGPQLSLVRTVKFACGFG